MKTLLVFLCSALLQWAVHGQGVRYEPATPAEREIAAECETNLTSRDKYTVSLLRYTLGAEQPVTIVQTDTPNADPYEENCSTIAITNSSSLNDSIRTIVRLNSQNICQDVLFLANGTADPVVCGYVPLAGPIIDYKPLTEEEKDAESRCKQYLPHPHGTRPTLVKYESDPEGKFPGYNLFNTNFPYDGDPFREDCANLSQGTSNETRPIISIDTCHDVLFFENGTNNPIVCLYLNTFEVVHGGQGNVYTPITPDEEKVAEKCNKKNLTPLDRYTVSLRKYTLVNDNQRASIHKTDMPDSNDFVEDCSTVGISNFTATDFRDILYLVNGTDVTCHDVLFLYNDSDPVVCYYEAIVSKPIIDYKPRNEEEREIEKQCKDNLPHPQNSFVSLVQYESNPHGAFPGYSQWNVTYPNTQDPFRENCSILLNSLGQSPDPSVDDTRPIIRISESGTCHDVLFYNGTNPIVCLYVTNPEVVTIVHKPSSIIVLFFTSLSVIASVVLLVTHFIFPSLQTNPSRVIMNLSTAFLLGDIFYIVQILLLLEDPSQSSAIVPVVLVAYYFFYARFVWMALAGFEMCRTIHVGTQLRFNSASKRLKILITYMITGWSLPLIPTIIMTIVHFENLEDEGVGKRSLFGLGGLVIVLVPVLVVMVFNVGIIVYLTYVLHKAYRWQIKVTEAIKSHRRKTNFSRIFIIILSLLGVTWILLFLVYIDGINESDAVMIISGLFNSIQPIFVSVAFLGTKKIFYKYKNLFTAKREDEPTDISAIQNRFRNRRLLSFLFTDKELAEAVTKHSHRPAHRFGRRNRTNSEISATSFSMFSRDSTHSLVSHPLASNGFSTPPRDTPSLAPICEEMEEPEEKTAEQDSPDEKREQESSQEKRAEDSPSHVTVDLQDSAL